ncbi:MAG: hypothetical protein ACRDI2_11960 [Chloroflexota bacterium]
MSAGRNASRGGAHPIARPRIDPRRTPFERTAAFRRFGPRIAPAAEGEHHYTTALIIEQGFDGLPHIVTAAEFDAYVAEGEVELFRGVMAAVHAQQLRSGTLYVGQGAFGGGIYAAGGADGRAQAAAYAQDPGGVVVRLCVKSAARLKDVEGLRAQMGRDRAMALARARDQSTAALAALAKSADESIFAAYLGYDGVVDTTQGLYLILNRTAVRIQDEDLQP